MSATPRTLERVGIAGLGYHVPDRRLTNHDLEGMVDTSDEWIVQRTGISERRIVADDEVCSTLAVRAAQAALDEAKMDPAEVDLILCCTVTGDQPFPATACRIGADLGAERAGGFDIGAACSGFVYGLQLADAMIRSGSEWAEIRTRVLAGITRSRRSRSLAMKSTKAGSVAHDATPVTGTPYGSAVERTRSRYWPIENAE